MVVTACYTNKVAKQLKKRKRQIQSGNIGDFVQQLKEETEPFAAEPSGKGAKKEGQFEDLVLVVDELKHGNQWPFRRIGYVS